MNKNSSKKLLPVPPLVSSKEMIEFLKLQKDKGEELLKRKYLSLDDVKSWNISSKDILTKALGPRAENIESILHAGDKQAYPAYEPDSILEKRRREKVQLAINMIASCLKYLENPGREPIEPKPSPSGSGEPLKREAPDEEEEESSEPDALEEDENKLEEDENKVVPDDEDAPEEAIANEEKPIDLVTEDGAKESQGNLGREEKLDNRKVLIISGQEKGKKSVVIDFLKQLGLKPVIPQEETGQEENLLEKYEKYSDVAFAILLLTGDEYGYPKGKPEEAKPRPKQNVIFELGFLLGRLKQSNVFTALYEEGLDLPAQCQENFFIPFDTGGLWKLLTARAMKMAQVEIDMNKAV